MTFNIACSHYIPHIGGIENYTYHFAKELVAQGHHVNVITSNTENSLKFQVEDGINVYRLKCISLLNDRYPFYTNPFELFWIYNRCFRDKNVITIVQTRFFLISLIATFLASIGSQRKIIIDHGTGHMTYQNSIVNFLSHSYEHITTFFIKSLKPTFYGVSESCNKWLAHFKIDAKDVIYNGIDYKYKIRGDFNLSNNINLITDKIIFYGGRLIPEKGILELVDAYKIFSKKNLNYKLVLAGSGVLESQIKELSKSCKGLIFVGRLSKDEMFQYLNKTSIFVNPSNYPEGLPTVILEAGKFALPVISTPNGGAKEVIIHKQTGYIIDNGSVDKILEALNYISNNYKEAKVWGRNLESVVREKFDWPQIVSKFIKGIN